MTALRVDGLAFRYPDGTVGLEHSTLRVEGGEVVGLLGPNGSGKTTLLRAIARAALHPAPTVGVEGDPEPRVALALDRPVFRDWLAGTANLETLLRLGGRGVDEARERAEEWIGRLGLTDVAERPVGAYSRGMKQRLGLALAFATGAGVILLDEPLAALDPSARERFVAALGSARTTGSAVVLSTHEPEFAGRECDRVAFLSGGRIVALDRPGDLLARISGDTRLVIGLGGAPAPDPAELGPPPPEIGAVERDPDGLVLLAKDGATALPAGVGWLLDRGVRIATVVIREPGLRDAYFALTGDCLEGPSAPREA